MHALHITIGSLALGLVGLLCVLWTTPPPGHPPENALLIGLSDAPRSLDPHTTTTSSDFRIATNLYEGLVRFGSDDLTPHPALARSWTVSDDALHYTFSLRRDVRFHDGTPFNAEAVRFNLERLLDKQHPYHDTGPFPLAFFFEAIERVLVIDEHTVRLELSEPFAPLLSNLAYPTGFIVSPDAVRKYRSDFRRHPSGTGPFRLSDWQEGRGVVLERFADYHGKSARMARLIFRPIADPMTRVAELMSGGLDVAVELPPDNVTWFRRSEQFQVQQVQGPHLWFLILNTRKPPFDDVRVRRAVNLAVNKAQIVRHVLQQTATVAAGPIPAAFGAASGPTKPYPHDPKRARALIKAAGASGAKLVLVAPESGSGMLAPLEMATAIQADLSAVGLDVEVRSYEWNTYLTLVNAGLDEVHLAEMAWMTNDPDTLVALALQGSAHPPRGFNSGWYRNPDVDALAETARRTPHRAEREQLYERIQRIVHDDAPWLFVASWKQNLVSRRRVHGVHLSPSFLIDFRKAGKQ